MTEKTLTQKLLSAPYVPLLGLMFCLQMIGEKVGTTIANPDTFFHLAMGKRFASGEWSIVTPGHFSHYENGDWVATQWLSQLVFYGLETFGGVKLLGATLAIVAMGLVAFLYYQMSKLANHWVALGLIVLFLLGNSTFINARPMIFSLVFWSIMVFAMHKSSGTGKPAYWLIAMQWLWVMVHGFWVVGLVTMSALAVGIVAARGWNENKKFLLLPLGGLAVSFLTPLGWKVWASVLLVSGRAKGFLTEWDVPDFTHPELRYCLVVVFLAVGFAMFTKTNNAYTLMVMIIGLGWSVYSIRTLTLAVILLLPLIATESVRYLPKTPPILSKLKFNSLLSGVCVVPAAVVLLSISLLGSVTPNFGSPVDKTLAELPAGTNIFSHMPLAGVLLWQQPHLSQYFHGYVDMYTDEEFAHKKTVGRADYWLDTLIEDKVTHILLYGDDNVDTDIVDADGRWERIAESPSYTLFELKEK